MEHNHNTHRWSFTGFITGYRCTKLRQKPETVDNNDAIGLTKRASTIERCSFPVETAVENRRRWWLPSFFRSPKIAPANHRVVNNQTPPEVEIKSSEAAQTSPSKSPSQYLFEQGEASGPQLSTTDHLLTFINPEELRSLSRLSQSNDNKSNVPHTPIKVVKNNQQALNFTSWPIAPGSVPTFQTFGHNGSQLMENILLTKGWIMGSGDVKFVWGESLSKFTIWDFREGDQMFNHIPNTHLLSNKLCLLRCLQDYSAIQISSKKTGLRISDFVPETYRLDLKQDQYMYTQRHKNGDVWICKPAMLNQGKGIFLVRTCEELKNKMKLVEAEEQAKTHFSKPASVRVIQRYVSSPLLLDGRKADIRSFMLIASAKPYVVLFRHGYVRLSCNDYDVNCTDLNTHLTNQCMQRKSPKYEEMKDDTVWDMGRLNDYINYHEQPKHKNWVNTTFKEQMCRIMLHCFHAVKSKLDRRLGLFELLGFDFLIDSSYKVWLLEINVNPSLQINSQVLNMIIPAVLNETVDIVYECFEKGRRGMRILPLHSKREFVLLYCEEMPYIKTIPPCKTTVKIKAKTNNSPC